jgi:hypothetical protein
MHCLKQVSGDVACYVTNYGSGYNNESPGATPDIDDAQAAHARRDQRVATVAMGTP